jgi:hypothetical protein
MAMPTAFGHSKSVSATYRKTNLSFGTYAFLNITTNGALY